MESSLVPDAELGVVVVTHNSATDIGGFLDSLDVSTQRSAVRLRVVVVDNASSDATLARVAAHRVAVAVVSSLRNEGYAAGLNDGLRRLPGELPVLVANPDVRIRPGSIECMLDATRRLPDAGVVVPRLEDADGRLLPSLRRDPTVRATLAEALVGGRRAGALGVGEVVTSPRAYEQERDVDWATGAAMVLTPAGRRAVPTWDESYFLYSEETAYCRDIRAAGLRVHFVPDAAVVHAGGSLHDSCALWALRAVNRVRWYARHRSLAAARAFQVAASLFEARRAMGGNVPARHALRSLTCRDLDARAERIIAELRTRHAADDLAVVTA